MITQVKSKNDVCSQEMYGNGPNGSLLVLLTKVVVNNNFREIHNLEPGDIYFEITIVLNRALYRLL